MADIHISNLFPTPLMRIENFLDDKTVAKIADNARNTHRENNAKTDLLSHSQPIHPKDDQNFHAIYELAAPHLADFGFLLLVKTSPGR